MNRGENGTFFEMIYIASYTYVLNLPFSITRHFNMEITSVDLPVSCIHSQPPYT